MITVTGTVRSALDASNAFAYLAAFEHTPEWDPGTPVVKKLSDGPVAVGHRYHAEAEFRGKRQTLIYEVVELAGTRITLRGENKSVISVDTIDVMPSGSGSEVRYTAEFQLKGWLKPAEPFVRPAFQSLAAPAMDGMKKALDARASR
ncbi:Polyketide cyclase / dehydrase and lipid transport [Arthrobacter sp. ok909]|uniref:SRPBCC family protein n=1 Tax=Arthrobacter sp. ok909 TaxID=1761746 RepID=UPI00088E44A1|nr:SRPBCC family protein [Arthrobacter sp. ok909]SDP24259.1 Polyketide cyclase / dehydrase and lipid transport [Arthrobacter sp. ok909]